MDDAKRDNADFITVWGTGSPRREFLHADDCADALVHLMVHYSNHGHVNVGYGEDFTILQLVEEIREIVGYDGGVKMDPSKPDGTPRKLIDSSLLRQLGWSPRIALRDGLRMTYEWYVSHRASSYS